MTDVVAVLSIPIEGDPAKLDATLRKIEDQLDKLGSGKGAAIGEPFQRAVPHVQAAERATLSFAQARARLLRDQGNLAGAERVLQGALAGTRSSTVQTISVERQLLAVRRELGGAATAGGGLGEFLNQAGAVAGRADALIGTLTGLGGAFAAVQVAGAAIDFARAGASIDAARQSFDNLAKTAGTSGDALLASLDQAAAGTVAQADLIKSSNTALLLLGSEVATKLPQLLAVAKASATALGTDVGQVFDSLVTGISRGSTELIDNAGITVRAAEAYASYAAEIGKSADTLSQAEKQQAILNAVLQSGQTIIEQSSGGGEAAAASYQRMDAALQDLAATAQIAAANAFAPLAEAIAGSAAAIEGLFTAGEQATAVAAQVTATAASYEAYRASIAAVNAELGTIGQAQQVLSAEQFAYAQALVASGVAAEAALQRTLEFGANIGAVFTSSEPAIASLGERLLALGQAGGGAEEAAFNLALAYNEGGLSAEQLASQLTVVEQQQAAVAAAQAEATAAAEAQAQANAAAASMIDTASAASQAQAQALQAATQAAFEQANAGADLEAQARAAAQALIEAGGAGASAAGQLAGSSALVDKLTAAYYRLLTAQRAAGAGGGALGNLGGPGGLVKGAGEATAAIRALNRVYGAGPLASSTKPKASGGGGSASTAADKEEKDRASQYQKLLSIQERYQDTALAAETRYQERVLEIQQRFAEQQLEAQRELASASVSSRADFYEGLVNTDLPADIAQSLSAAYEAAFAEAQQMAQSGNAAIADDFLALKQRQIDAERQYQEKVAALADSKDKKQAANEKAKLDAIKKLRDQEFAVEEAQLREQGGGEAQTRDAALADAAEQRDAALNKAQLDAQDALAAAEQRKSEAARITNEQLQEQLRLVEQIAQRGGVPTTPSGGTPVTGATQPLTTPTAPVATSPADADPAGLAARLDALKAVTERGLGDVRRAIDSLDARSPFTS